MEKVRIGNDVPFEWTLELSTGEAFDFEGTTIKLKDPDGNACEIDITSKENGVVKGCYRGKNQKLCGEYALELVQNEGQDNQVTLDQQAWELVARTADTGGTIQANIELKTIYFSSIMAIRDLGSRIKSMEQTKTSTESGGLNEFTFTLSDGTKQVFVVRNGERGTEIEDVDTIRANAQEAHDATYQTLGTSGTATATQLYAQYSSSQIPGIMGLILFSTTKQTGYSTIYKCCKLSAGETITIITEDKGTYIGATTPVDTEAFIAVQNSARSSLKFVYTAETDCDFYYFRDIRQSPGDENAWTYETASQERSEIIGNIKELNTRASTLVEAINKAPTNADLADKVDKVTGKGLSANDYTTDEKTKLSGIAEGATKNDACFSLNTNGKGGIQGSGFDCSASGANSFAVGNGAYAHGDYSIAEGHNNEANGESSHAEGSDTSASGACAHVEGSYTTASGEASHAEGENTTASGEASHAEGENTTAKGKASHAEGLYTQTTNVGEHAEGRYNKSTSGATLDSVGIGTSSARKNAEETTADGKKYILGVGGYDGTNVADSSVQDIATYIAALEARIKALEDK